MLYVIVWSLIVVSMLHERFVSKNVYDEHGSFKEVNGTGDAVIHGKIGRINFISYGA